MFSKFFYTLKEKGLDVSLSEWLTLQDALQQGLCHSSLTEFYYVARMILVKSETEYDKFDLAFDEVFKGIMSENEVGKNMMRWLDKPEMQEVWTRTMWRINSRKDCATRTRSITAAVTGSEPWVRRPSVIWAAIWAASESAGPPDISPRFR